MIVLGFSWGSLSWSDYEGTIVKVAFPKTGTAFSLALHMESSGDNGMVCFQVIPATGDVKLRYDGIINDVFLHGMLQFKRNSSACRTL
jgi:hypothetical protein